MSVCCLLYPHSSAPLDRKRRIPSSHLMDPDRATTSCMPGRDRKRRKKSLQQSQLILAKSIKRIVALIRIVPETLYLTIDADQSFPHTKFARVRIFLTMEAAVSTRHLFLFMLQFCSNFAGQRKWGEEKCVQKGKVRSADLLKRWREKCVRSASH